MYGIFKYIKMLTWYNILSTLYLSVTDFKKKSSFSNVKILDMHIII